MLQQALATSVRASTMRPVIRTHLLQCRHLFTYSNQGHQLLRPDVRWRPRNRTNHRSVRDTGKPKLPNSESPQPPTRALPHCHAPPPCPSRLNEDDVFQASFQICCMLDLAATVTFSTFCDRFKQGFKLLFSFHAMSASPLRVSLSYPGSLYSRRVAYVAAFLMSADLYHTVAA